MQQQVYFVGTESEVGHHAAPLSETIDYRIAEPNEVLAVAKPGDLAVFFSEHFDRFRHSLQTLKERRVATLYMIDGILEWRNAWMNRHDEPACPFTMRPVLAHKVACIGRSQARVLCGWGNASKVELVGVPRFDRLRRDDNNLTPRTTANRRPFRMLVVTAKCPSYTQSQNDILEQSLLDLKNHLEAIDDLEIVWRLTADWDQKLGVENQLTDLSGEELATILSTVDAVVATPSTAALESMLFDLPTAILDYNNNPKYVQAVWNITAANHLKSQIAELMVPPRSKIDFQRQLLGDTLQIRTSAVERMSQLIDSMLKLSRQAVADNQDIVFPAPLLEPISNGSNGKTQALEFDHASVFPDYPEFTINDTAELQSQLAHSRREIRHLHSQLEQIQAELKQAHKIFDEINSHPIAGPIVKIRRKLSAVLARLRRAKIQTKPN